MTKDLALIIHGKRMERSHYLNTFEVSELVLFIYFINANIVVLKSSLLMQWLKD